MSRVHLPRIVVAVLIVLCAAPAARPQSAENPCELLQAAEIVKHFRSPVNPGERAGNVCRWRASKGPGSVVLQMHSTGGPTIYARDSKLLGVDEQVKGIGDEAYRSGLIIGARSGDRFFSLTVAPNVGGGPMPRAADAVALARLVAGAWWGAKR
jgi:hypothetical protein